MSRYITADVEDFPPSLRFKMVKSYPVISQVPDVYEASRAEINEGFARIMDNRNLAPTLRMWLRDHKPYRRAARLDAEAAS